MPSRTSVAAQGDAVEELQGAAGLVIVAPGDVPLLDEVEQVGADLLGAEALGRACRSGGRSGRRTRRRPGWSLGVKLRRVMSSIMRRRRGVMCGSFASERGVEVRNPFMMPQRSREEA